MPVPRWTARLAACLMVIAPSLTTQAAERPVPQTEPAVGAAERIDLWPTGQVPGEPASAPPPRVMERSDTPALPDRYIDGVNAPYMVVYRPARANGSALLVIPGGGYQRIVLDNEGSSLVPAFAEQGGVTLFVLRYRLPTACADGDAAPAGKHEPDRIGTPDSAGSHEPDRVGTRHACPRDTHRRDRQSALADAQRALRLIRHDAARWHLDPHRIGVIGFSAGGHIAARLSTGFATVLPGLDDAIDRESARPDFALLMYPVIDMGPHAHSGSRERLLGPNPDTALIRQFSMQQQVRADTPPTFLVHAQDDDVVSVHNSLLYYQALLQAGIPAEMHLFPYGRHGFGVRLPADVTTAQWPTLALRWMQAPRPKATP
jgi:acetyl esterase/lipase